MSSATLEATAGLFERYESEIKALDQRQRAAAQSLKATEETQQELSGRVAELLVDLKAAEGKVNEARQLATTIVTSAEKQAHGILTSAQKDAAALRKRGDAAIEAMKRALEGVN
jgi:predicted  nucleic acid-binding Zn-ribbon protein